MTGGRGLSDRAGGIEADLGDDGGDCALFLNGQDALLHRLVDEQRLLRDSAEPPSMDEGARSLR